MAVQWLGLGTCTAGAWVQSLVGEDFASCVAQPKKKKERERMKSAICNNMDITLSEESQTEKDKYCMISPIRGIH